MNKNLVSIRLWLPEAKLHELLENGRLSGRVLTEIDGAQTRFCFVSAKRCKRRREQVLLRLPHGSIRKSPRRYKLVVSVSDEIGEARVGQLMQSQAEEAGNFMNALERTLDLV